MIILQNEADKEVSDWLRDKIAAYMQWKYEADKDLVERTAFSWTILRPGTLTHEPGVGKACIGRTHITESIAVSGFHSPSTYILTCIALRSGMMSLQSLR